MSRVAIYTASLFVFIGVTALTLSSIIIPRWTSYEDTSIPINYYYGLHKRCTSAGDCAHFPSYADCHGTDRYFCSMWRSTAWLMSFTLVIEGMNIVAFIVILAGGPVKRMNGWRMLGVLLLLNAIIQGAATSLVQYLYDYDDRFFVGWSLGISWVLATVSWVITVILAGIVVVGGWYLPPEGGYEFLK
ncbi:uncharacterized protein LAJ45_10513 [Morchella importuna]|uniref:uncharacterized protein n=1 Tax=Morchella importuna TaxID=1174673 RepID=UPI001E8EEC2A|nr:uncharacterized protein LAJ45_10513 [Morchella importuna]KAH8145543.1 hypothetical protein LAJ45_10513 [Morchella importuna]